MMQVSAKDSIINYVVLCDISEEVKPFLSTMHPHTQVDAHGYNIATCTRSNQTFLVTCTMNTLTQGTQESR